MFISPEETKEASDILYYNTHIADMYMENIRQDVAGLRYSFDVTATFAGAFPGCLEMTDAEDG